MAKATESAEASEALAERAAAAALFWARRRDADGVRGAVAGLSADQHARVVEALTLREHVHLTDDQLLARMNELATKAVAASQLVDKTAAVGEAYVSAALPMAPPDLGEFTAYASTWTDGGGPDRQGDTVAPGAYSAVVAAINAGTVSVPVLAGDGHEDMQALAVVGRIVEAKEDSVGLWVRGRYAADERSQTIRAKAASGALSLSVFGPILDSRPTATGRELLAIDLMHVLLTPTPANRSALMLTAKSDVRDDLAELELWARAEEAEAALGSMVDDPAAMAQTAEFLLAVKTRAELDELEAWAATVRVPSDAEVAAEVRRLRWDVDNNRSYALAVWQRKHAGHRRCRTNGDCDE